MDAYTSAYELLLQALLLLIFQSPFYVHLWKLEQLFLTKYFLNQGVGNTLKRHYETYLLEYELAHDDVDGECCLLCNRSIPFRLVLMLLVIKVVIMVALHDVSLCPPVVLLEIGLTVGFVVSGHILAVIEDQVSAPSRYHFDLSFIS